MLQENISYVLLGGLAILLILAAFTDLRERKIANWLNITIAAAAPVFWWSSGLSVWPEMAVQIGMGVAFFCVGSALFAMKQMGGGDVKLLSALALWIGPEHIVAFITLFALSGWLLTIVTGTLEVVRSGLSNRSRLHLTILISSALFALYCTSAYLGGPRLSNPQIFADKFHQAVALYLIGMTLLVMATLGPVRIIKKYNSKLATPYGVAIVFAAIWMIVSEGPSWATQTIPLG